MMETRKRGKASAEVKTREKSKDEQHHPKAQGREQGKDGWHLRQGESELPGDIPAEVIDRQVPGKRCMEFQEGNLANYHQYK